MNINFVFILTVLREHTPPHPKRTNFDWTSTPGKGPVQYMEEEESRLIYRRSPVDVVAIAVEAFSWTFLLLLLLLCRVRFMFRISVNGWVRLKVLLQDLHEVFYMHL